MVRLCHCHLCIFSPLPLTSVDEDPSHLWPVFIEEFQSKLPLKKVFPSGKATTVRSTKTFPLVRLEFRPFQKNVQTPKNPLCTHLQPHLHLILVTSEDGETYRTVQRPLINDWLEHVHQRK